MAATMESRARERERDLLLQLKNVERELATLVQTLEDSDEDRRSEGDSSGGQGGGRDSSGSSDGIEDDRSERGGERSKLPRGKGPLRGGRGFKGIAARAGNQSLQVALAKERIKGLLERKKVLHKDLKAVRGASGSLARPAAASQPNSSARTSADCGTRPGGRLQGTAGVFRDGATSELAPPSTTAGARRAGAGVGRGRDAPTGASVGGLVESNDLDLELDAADAALVETERDRMIRIGAITPFDRLQGFDRAVQSAGVRGSPSTHASVQTNRDGTSGASGPVGATENGSSSVASLRLKTKVLASHEVPSDAGITAERASFAQYLPKARKKRPKIQRPKASRKWARLGAADGPESLLMASDGEGKERQRRRHKRAELVKSEDGGAGDSLALVSATQEGASRGGRRQAGSRARAQQEASEDEDGSEEGSSSEEAYEPAGESTEDSDASDDQDDVSGSDSADKPRRANKERAITVAGTAGGGRRGDGSGEGSPVADVELEGGLRIPGDVYEQLFEYQRTAVKWMWELHCQQVGGILGDEMGLGKTVQIAAFLGALQASGLFSQSLIVCPLTLLRQWARELRRWCPSLRPVILHNVVTERRCKSADASSEEAEDVETEDDGGSASEDGGTVRGRGLGSKKARRAFQKKLRQALACPSAVVITTYEQVRIFQDELLGVNWGYAVLDEGHKIRNPDAIVTLACKQLRTPHRLLLTGCPIQNRLSELWSLMDFVYPGRLGTLPVFQAEFAMPIAAGGYASASGVQVTTAYRCAVLLRDIILPYLLRRVKKDVALQLPQKQERVLLCPLTEHQRRLYCAFLHSDEVQAILDAKRNMLYGIDILRKICNHPDLVTDGDGPDSTTAQWYAAAQAEAKFEAQAMRLSGREEGRPQPRHVNGRQEQHSGVSGIKIVKEEAVKEEEAEESALVPLKEGEEPQPFVFGDPVRSAKLQVAEKILEEWKREGHKALVFCQTQQMLDIFEALVVRHAWAYRRMDGSTAPSSRSALIDEFNSSLGPTISGAHAGQRSEDSIFVFLLTTRVGGLGTNLTAANRVLIFDPDWNPSTDLQARERAWRIGQKREVIIYRLLTRGTIEEKVYHRQIVKQQLSSRVLKDPRQRRLFRERDLKEIFKVSDELGGGGALSARAQENPLETAFVLGSALAKAGNREGLGRDGDGDGEGPDGAPEAGDSGTSILQKLFDGKAIHAALDHDAVEKLAAEARPWALEHAATRAARAADALRQSQQLRARSDVSEPTWTGRSGSAGIPGTGPRRFGGQSTGAPGAARAAGQQFGTQGGGQRSSAPGPGAGVASVGAPLSSGDLLARLREKRLAASGALPPQAGPSDSGQLLASGREPVAGVQGGGLGLAGVSMPDVETEVAKMLDAAGERGLSSMDIVRGLAAALGAAGRDIAAMHRALDRVGMRRGGAGRTEDVRWIRRRE